VICRKKFDNYLADMARRHGAKFHLGHSFVSFERKGKKIISKINSKSEVRFSESDILIGADGPLSPVAKSAGLFGERNFVIGTQIEAKMKNDNAVEFYPYLGCYAWVVPKNKEVVRIGVSSYKNSPEIFRKFASERLGKDYRDLTIENQSGVIPVFKPDIVTEKDNVYLVGDAATFVKATTGGGINQSLRAATILADCIENKKNYDKEWRKSMYRNLHMHLIIHKMMQKFSDSDWNELVSIFSQDKMKKILYSESRDKIVSMIVKIAAAEPSLFRFSRHFPFRELKNTFG
jgi:geranylgeranyl reductase